MKTVEQCEAEARQYLSDCIAEEARAVTAFTVRTERSLVVPTDQASEEDLIALNLLQIHGKTLPKIHELFTELKPYIEASGDVTAPYAIPKQRSVSAQMASTPASTATLQPRPPHQITALMNNQPRDILYGDHVKALPLASNAQPFARAIGPAALYITLNGAVAESSPAALSYGQTIPPLTPLPDQQNTYQGLGLLKWQGYDPTVQEDEPIAVTQLFCTVDEMPARLQDVVYRGLAYAKRHMEQVVVVQATEYSKAF